jgi:glycine/serine hydroxymethyltransferase
MKAADMSTVAAFILEALRAAGDSAALESVRARVEKFAAAFPAPGVTDGV